MVGGAFREGSCEVCCNSSALSGGPSGCGLRARVEIVLAPVESGRWALRRGIAFGAAVLLPGLSVARVSGRQCDWDGATDERLN